MVKRRRCALNIVGFSYWTVLVALLGNGSIKNNDKRRKKKKNGEPSLKLIVGRKRIVPAVDHSRATAVHDQSIPNASVPIRPSVDTTPKYFYS